MTPSPFSTMPSPATPRRDIGVFSAHHLKHAVADVVPPGVMVAGQPAAGAVVGCQLVGGGLMVVATLAAHTVVRYQRQHLTRIAADDINAVIVLEGAGQVEAPGWSYRVGAGDILYQGAGSLSTLRIDQASRLLVLRLSFRRFSNGQVGKIGDFKAALALRESALRLAVFHHVHEVMPSLGESALATVAHAEQALIALLAAVYAEARAAGPAPPSRWDQLAAAVDAMLGDADLDVAALAAALRVSPRQVHRLFERQGHSYSSYLLGQRLARAHEDLRRPVLADIGVAQIGYRAGFNSASHFGRSFKRRYGLSPLAHRLAP